MIQKDNRFRIKKPSNTNTYPNPVSKLHLLIPATVPAADEWLVFTMDDHGLHGVTVQKIKTQKE